MRVNIEQLDQGSAVYCQDLSLVVRVRIIKATTRVWRLIPQSWQNGMWYHSESIGTQKSQAQALVHAGAFLQAVREMAGQTQEGTAGADE